MISFAKTTDDTPKHVERIKNIVEDYLQTQSQIKQDDLPTVMVSQIKCTEDGCAPIETVISLLSENNNRTGKIFKPIKDVTKADTLTFLTTKLLTKA